MYNRRLFRRGAAVGAVAVMLSVAGIAQAHPRLLSASPAANATVSATNRLVLSFSERLIRPLSGANLYMSHDGHAIKMGSLRPFTSPDGKTLVLFTGRPLAKGGYRLDWHAVSVDTHRVSGTISFSVK